MQSDFSDELVILGNGFDLSSGMKSKYGDYFKSREEISSEIEDIWKLFKTTYYEDDSNVLQILNELGKSNETHEIDKDKRDFYNFFMRLYLSCVHFTDSAFGKYLILLRQTIKHCGVMLKEEFLNI